MRIIHGVAWYPPFSMGGTEAYVMALIASLEKYGVQNSVFVPGDVEEPTEYTHDGVRVVVLPSHLIRREQSGSTDNNLPSSWDVVWRMLSQADVFHQHSWTPTSGRRNIELAKSFGCKIILTVHVASFACLRGTMLEFGISECDGKIDIERCAACWAQSRGFPKTFSGFLRTVLRHSFGQTLPSRSRLFSKFGTLLRARELASSKREDVEFVADKCDGVVAVSKWLYESLRTNANFGNKLVLVRAGLTEELCAELKGCSKDEAWGVHRFGYLGRLDELKGLHIIVEAMKSRRLSTRATLEIFATGSGPESRLYLNRIIEQIGSASHIKINNEVGRSQLASVFSQLDTLLVPSLVMETGPLVILEALAARVTVIGSDLGGIRELSIEHGEEWVRLVPPGEVSEWIYAMSKSIDEGGKADLSAPQVPTMKETVRAMIKLYKPERANLQDWPSSEVGSD